MALSILIWLPTTNSSYTVAAAAILTLYSFMLNEQKSAFRSVPFTGVIYVSNRARELGYGQSEGDWCNLGQGQPETGVLEHGPARLSNIPLHENHREYGPVSGLRDIKDAVAQFYNRRFRGGMGSQYSGENVSICAGGRLAMSRVVASLGHVNVGHFLPDYTAYEELLDIFRVITPIPITLEGSRGYEFTPRDLEKEVLGRGLSALLFSNPCNPTGKTVQGEELNQWINETSRLNFALICDEFYSHYVWHDRFNPQSHMVSAAQYIDDVEKQDVLILDGLTKNWRYPGLRLAWIVGPKSRIKTIDSTGSFLDGGACAAVQQVGISLLDDNVVDAENKAIFTCFNKKRQLMLSELPKLGLEIEASPEGGFYVWINVKNLPAPLNHDLGFFESMLKCKVITVPGRFFDVNPGRRRVRPSRFSQHIRLSFGPSIDTLKLALGRMKAAI